ncbi:unnamed protein product, partial [Ectocarpus sp. 4 AP-2014]
MYRERGIGVVRCNFVSFRHWLLCFSRKALLQCDEAWPTFLPPTAHAYAATLTLARVPSAPIPKKQRVCCGLSYPAHHPKYVVLQIANWLRVRSHQSLAEQSRG